METKHVCILQYRLLHYRVALFNQLREELFKSGIELHLVHGQPTKTELRKQDTGSIQWANVVENKYITIGGKDILWQPQPEFNHKIDLVIVMQENRLLSNYSKLFFRNKHSPKVAYWGHGINFQSKNKNGLREKWKLFLLDKVDWWFAYTEMSADLLSAANYPKNRITVLNNAIDNNGFKEDLLSITSDKETELQEKINSNRSSKIGIFCGSLYPDKKLDFLVEAADKIHTALPDFRLVILGDGPSRDIIEKAIEGRSWMTWVGVKKGIEKAGWYKVSDIVLNPGLVGLHVLDSFCSGSPMITTKEAKHSPEIAYLKDNKNGLIVDGDAKQYAGQVIKLLTDDALLDRLKKTALTDSHEYTLDKMVKSFSDGIVKCLNMDKYSK